MWRLPVFFGTREPPSGFPAFFCRDYSQATSLCRCGAEYLEKTSSNGERRLYAIGVAVAAAGVGPGGEATAAFGFNVR